MMATPSDRTAFRLQVITNRLRDLGHQAPQRFDLLDALLLHAAGQDPLFEASSDLTPAIVRTHLEDPKIQAALDRGPLYPLAEGRAYLALRHKVLTSEATAYRSTGGTLTSPWMAELVWAMPQGPHASVILDSAADIGTFLLVGALQALREGTLDKTSFLGVEADPGSRRRAIRAATILGLQPHVHITDQVPQGDSADLAFCHPAFSSRARQGRGGGWELIHQTLAHLAPGGEAFVVVPPSFAVGAKHRQGLEEAHAMARLTLVATIPDIAAFRQPMLLRFQKGAAEGPILHVDASGRRKDLSPSALAAAIRRAKPPAPQVEDLGVTMSFLDAQPGEAGFSPIPRERAVLPIPAAADLSPAIDAADADLHHQTKVWDQAWARLNALPNP